MTTIKGKIEQYITGHASELLTLCCDLIMAKSENPPGDVSEATQVVQAFLEQNRIGYELLEPRPDHINTIASVGEGNKTLILCGHIDTVPAGDETQWSFPPYCGFIRNGEILGRGATDMKGGVAATLMALAATKQVEKRLSGKVTAAIVCDEEIGGDYGAKWLLENNKLSGDACLITEPSAYRIAGYTIDAGERGVSWLRFRAIGKPAHGSWPIMGKNAILALTAFLPKLKVIEKIKVKTPKDAIQLIVNGKKILAKIAKKNKIPTETMCRILDHYTVNIGTITGGTKVNVVPEKCEVEADFRIPIGGSKGELEANVRKLLPKGVGYEVFQESIPSYTSTSDPLIQIIKANVSRFFGVTPPTIAIWATSDAWRFRKLLKIPTVTFGPGFSEKAHTYDETVLAEDIIRSAKVYANVILDYLQGWE